jgi:hypothetical protein
MHEADKVRKLKAYAQDVLAALDADAAAAEPGNQRLLQDIRSVAQETIRRAGDPIKIGVVGEFNAGKTLVLGSLIGFADALPVSEVPTTGNVTALRFVSRPELRKTEVGPFTVEFLDRATAIECLRELLRAADERSRDAGLAPAARQTLAGLRERAAAGPWAEVEAWCRQAWTHGGDNPNPALRNLLRELTWFVRCCQSPAGTALLDAADKKNRVYPIDAETAREGLALTRSNTSITALRFEEMPEAPGPMPQALTASWLRKAFPLIRRVDADVQLSSRIWDLSGMQGAGEWVLLDFPGLGAAESGVRDAFLCRRELREVQTILILLDGRRPGGEGGQNIFSMMNADLPPGKDLRDSILVVMNRFDQLPIQADGGEAVMERLIGWRDLVEQATDSLPAADPEPLPEKEVLTQLPVLGAMVVGARNLTRRDDRIVALSALWALADLQAVLPGDVPVASPDFLASLTALLKSPPLLRQKWERLAQLLREGDPRSSLARWLEDLTRDGGLGRLQRLIVDHVAQHGLRQLLDHVRVSAETLLNATRQLPKKRPAASAPSGPTADNVRQAVDGLYDTYTALKAEYEQVTPELTVAVNGHRLSLQQMVHDQVTRSVFEWPVWNELLNKVQKDGTILATAAAGPKKQGGWDEDDEPALKLPSDSREFFEPFKQTLQRNEGAALDCIRQAVREQLVALSKRTRPLVEGLTPLLADAKTRERLEEFDRKEKEQGRRAVAKGQLNVLRWASDPADKDTFERFLTTYLTEDHDAIAAEACFPLAGADVNQTPQRFPWARSQPTPGGNHQVLVLRLRDALADGMRRRVLQRVSQLNKQVLDGLKDTFTTWSERLLMLSGNAPLLASIAGEVSTQAAGPDWKSAAIEYPLQQAASQ